MYSTYISTSSALRHLCTVYSMKNVDAHAHYFLIYDVTILGWHLTDKCHKESNMDQNYNLGNLYV